MLRKPDLLQTILEYILALHRQSEQVAQKIRRHTVAFRRTVINLIREGVSKGEFAPVDAALAALRADKATVVAAGDLAALLSERRESETGETDGAMS